MFIIQIDLINILLNTIFVFKVVNFGADFIDVSWTEAVSHAGPVLSYEVRLSLILKLKFS